MQAAKRVVFFPQRASFRRFILSAVYAYKSKLSELSLGYTTHLRERDSPSSLLKTSEAPEHT